MTTLVIHTQYMENYAAHNEDFVGGVSEDYWKYKGGDTYFVDNLTASQVAKIEATGIPTLTKLIEYSTSGAKEYILDFEIRELGKDGDGKGPMCDTWETPIQFRWGGDRWLAQTNHTYGEDDYTPNPLMIAKAQQWIPLEGNERSDYKCQYKTANGWFDSSDPQLKVELKVA
jgi:hypothetical protein